MPPKPKRTKERTKSEAKIINDIVEEMLPNGSEDLKKHLKGLLFKSRALVNVRDSTIDEAVSKLKHSEKFKEKDFGIENDI